MMKQILYTFFLWLVCLSTNTYGLFDRSYFYRTSTFCAEPRLAADTLATFEIQYAGGSTSKAVNLCGDTVPICAYLPCCETIPCPKDLRARIFDLNINYYQNMIHGFFFHGHLPMTHALIHRDTKKNQRTISKHTAITNSSLMLGWALNYENTTHIDYVDFSIQLGALLPSEHNNCCPFPLGYQARWGVPVIADLSWGILDWLTFGTHVDFVIFPHKTIKSIIPLRQEFGAIWRVTNYTKADHFVRGLSLLVGFTYEQKDNDTFMIHTPFSARWDRSIFHFLLEWDFAKPNWHCAPRLGLFVNAQMTGTNVLSIDTGGSFFGIDWCWVF